MTKVLFNIGQDTIYGVYGVDTLVTAKAATRRVSGEILVTRNQLRESDSKPFILDLASTGLGQAWIITVSPDNGDTFSGYYKVPAGDTVNFTDLVEVDPESLEAVDVPDPEWWAVANSTINSGKVVNDRLILTRNDGVEVDAGNVRGLPGKDGTDGVNGAPGSDGVNGAPGSDGVSVVYTEINTDGDLLVTLSNDQVVNAGHARGADDSDVAAYISASDSDSFSAVNQVVNQYSVKSGTLYVSPTGLDSNDGTATSPLLTIQRAFDIIGSRGFLGGAWSVALSAGVYAPASLGAGISSKSFITLYGPAVGHPNIPTAVIDCGGATHGVGLSAPEGSKLSVKNIRITNATGTLSIGLHGGNQTDIYAENVHTDNIYSGIQVTNNSRLRQKGGVSSCTIGTAVGINSVFTIGYGNGGSTAGGAQFIGCHQGVKITEGSSGHVDYCIMDGCNIGIEVSQHSRVNDVRNNIKNSVITAIRGTKSCYANAGNVFEGNETNFINDSFTSYLPIATGSQGLQRVGRLYETITHTGTVNKTVLNTPFTMPAGYFTDNSKMLEIKVRGTVTSASGIATVGIDFGDTLAGAVSSSGNVSGTVFEATYEIFPMNSSNFKIITKLVQGVNLVRHSIANRTVELSQDTPIKVTGTISDAAGSIAVEIIEVNLVG